MLKQVLEMITGQFWPDEDVDKIKLEVAAKMAGCPPGTKVGLHVNQQDGVISVTAVIRLPDSKLN